MDGADVSAQLTRAGMMQGGVMDGTNQMHASEDRYVHSRYPRVHANVTQNKKCDKKLWAQKEGRKKNRDDINNTLMIMSRR